MYTCYIQSSKILASFCSWAGWFESYLFENARRHIFTWCGSINCKDANKLRNYYILHKLRNYYTLHKLRNYYTLHKLSNYYTLHKLSNYYTLHKLSNYYTLHKLRNYYTLHKLRNYYTLHKQYKKLIRKKQRNYKSKLLSSLVDLES